MAVYRLGDQAPRVPESAYVASPLTAARRDALVRSAGALLGGQPVQRGLVERDRRCLLFGQAFARAQPGFDRCRRMLGRREIAHPLLHGQSNQAGRLAQRQLAARVAGEQDGAPRIVAPGMLEGGGHQRGERHAKQTMVVECLARERKNVDVITPPGQSDRQRAEAKFQSIGRVDVYADPSTDLRSDSIAASRSPASS